MSARISALVCASVLLCGGGAFAETIEKTVRSGASTAVDGLFIYGVQSCEPGEIPDAKVSEPPKNGSVVIRLHEQALSKGTNCAGVKVKGPIFVYTPAKGFKGRDGFTIAYPFASTEVSSPTLRTLTYRITVE